MADSAPLQVLALGAGVQSTTLALMSLQGELPPLDFAMFADTQCEPESVYKHLWWLAGEFHDAGVPLYVISKGDLAEFALDPDKSSGTLPVFLVGVDGKRGIMRRQCTSDFKIVVMQQLIRAKRDGAHVDQWMGISLDEVARMTTSRKKYITLRYPLVDKRMSRLDCENWMARHGYSAPRSACYFCPFHNDHEWRRLRDDEPAEFQRAIDFEVALQAAHRTTGDKKRIDGTPYLHASRVPLSEVDLSTQEDHGQINMFDNECGGVCGV